MPIDASIYNNVRLPDFVGSYMRGKEYKDKRDEKEYQGQVKEAKKNVYTLSPDGKMEINQDGMAKMMSLAPEEGANMQRQFTQDQRATQQFDQESEKAGYESKLRGYDTVSRELRGATPENWGQKRSYLVQEGLLDEQDMSPVFDPQNQESLLNRSFSEGEAVANEFKRKGYDLNVDKQKEAVRHNKATEGISKAAQFAKNKTAEMNARKAKDPGFEEKEIIKEKTKVRAENRKSRKQLDKDYQTWDALEQQIDNAIKIATEYNSGLGPGSGAIAKTKSLFGGWSQDTQRLENSLQKLSLDQMVKQFAGMSKAIDTPAERAQFESTVPTIGMDDDVLMSELFLRKKAAASAKNRIKMGRNQYDKYGNFEGAEPELKNESEAYAQQQQQQQGGFINEAHAGPTTDFDAMSDEELDARIRQVGGQ